MEVADCASHLNPSSTRNSYLRRIAHPRSPSAELAIPLPGSWLESRRATPTDFHRSIRFRHRPRHGTSARRGASRQMPKKSGVAIAFIGERAANQGAFHETLNLAAISAAKKRWIEQPIPVPVVKERRRSIGMLSSSDFRPNGLADSWR